MPVIFALFFLMFNFIHICTGYTQIKVIPNTHTYFIRIKLTGASDAALICGDWITNIQIWRDNIWCGYFKQFAKQNWTEFTWQAGLCPDYDAFINDLPISILISTACNDTLQFDNFITSLNINATFYSNYSLCDNLPSEPCTPLLIYTPTKSPTSNPISNTTINTVPKENNGIFIEINFQYDVKIQNVNITNILTNITKTIIQNQLYNASVCVNNQEYDIKVVLNTTNNQSFAIITSSVFGCNEEDKNTLSVIFIDEQLSKALIESTNDNEELFVYPDTVNVDVDIIGDITTTNMDINIITTDGVNDKNKDDDTSILMNILLITIVILLILIVGILIFYIKRRKTKLESNTASKIEIESCSPSIVPSVGQTTITKRGSGDVFDLNTNGDILDDEGSSDIDDLYLETNAKPITDTLKNGETPCLTETKLPTLNGNVQITK